MNEKEVLREIEANINSDNLTSILYDLIEGAEPSGVSSHFCERVIYLLLKFENAQFGNPGPLIRLIEGSPSYRENLVKAANSRVNENIAFLLVRILNGHPEDDVILSLVAKESKVNLNRGIAEFLTDYLAKRDLNE